MDSPTEPKVTAQAPEWDDTRQRFVEEIREAVELLDFAIAQGRRVADTLILRIKKAQAYLGETAPWPADPDRADFEAAYRDLAQFMLPITAATLRATRDEHGPNSWLRFWLRFWRSSDAKWFSRRLYGWVILCAGAIVADEVHSKVGGRDPFSLFVILTNLMPFLYGLLGALVYLLRSAHTYIADRTFDLYRAPEYYNRMVLGFVSGGVVLVFVKSTEVGPTAIGPNAVSFLVGYNTDYLFQTIERIADAVFPKAGSSDGKAGPPGIAKVDIPNPNIKAGASGNGSVVLTAAAPGGGVPVTLAAPSDIMLASSVSVSQGATTANFTFTVSPGATAGSQFPITATANGTSASGSVTVG